MKDQYLVKSGELEMVVKAKNHEEAAIKAVKKFNGKSLGLLMSVLKSFDSDDDKVYLLTTRVLDECGYNSSI